MENSTPEKWFQLLIEPYKSQAIENIQPEYAHMKYSSLTSALKSFPWHQTKQGYNHWQDVLDSLVKLESKFLNDKKEEPRQSESELKEVEVYFYTDGDNWNRTGNLDLAIKYAESGSTIYKGVPIGTKQIKSFLEPIK
jgi:hypothetical protein